MLDVYGSSYPPPRPRWKRPLIDAGRAAARDAKSYGFFPHALSAAVLATLTLHLLARLASHLGASDAAGALSVFVGMATVLVTLTPFTVLCARRAHGAWCRAVDRTGRRS
ncbi:hypothetical protein [Azospirillum sp. sgz302134]